MRHLYTLFAFVFLSMYSNAQQGSTDAIIPYDYDTTLKGGYNISFQVKDSLQYLYLKKGKKTIAELSSTSKGLLYKNLGYVGADFKDYFVLVHSYGSGNPHYIQLFKKSTGINLLQEGAAWIDADENLEYLLYSYKGVPRTSDKMILYNVRTGKSQLFNFPSDIFNAPQILNRIQITSITPSQLIISYETASGRKTKRYKR